MGEYLPCSTFCQTDKRRPNSRGIGTVDGQQSTNPSGNITARTRIGSKPLGLSNYVARVMCLSGFPNGMKSIWDAFLGHLGIFSSDVDRTWRVGRSS